MCLDLDYCDILRQAVLIQVVSNFSFGVLDRLSANVCLVFIEKNWA